MFKRLFTSQALADARQPIALLIGLYVAGLLVRLVVVMGLGLSPNLDKDEFEYVNAARSLTRGLGYAIAPQGTPIESTPVRTAFRMPGPSLLMAAVITLCGEDVRWLRLAAMLVSSLSVPLIYLFSRQIMTHQTGTEALSPPRQAQLDAHKVGLISALICSAYPLWIQHSMTCKSEPCFIPLLLITQIVVARLARERTASAGLKTGLMWGLLTYVKPYGLPMAGLSVVQYWWSHQFRRLRPALALGLGFWLMLSPWIVRNYVVFDAFIPLATEGSETFLGTNNPYVFNNPDEHGMWLSPMEIEEYRLALEPFHNEIDRARERKRIAMAYLKSHPKAAAWLALWKLQKMYSFVSGSGVRTSVIVACTWGVLFVLFLTGLLRRTFVCSTELQLILMWFVMQTIVSAVYSSGYSRGRLPLEILLIPWGVISARSLVRKFFS